jgi:trigger factor
VPVGQPKLENVEQAPFRYRVTVPVEPAVELADYSGFRHEFAPEPVSDETVQKLLDAQREQHVVLKELGEPRPAQPGDMVTVLIESDEAEDDSDDEDDDDEFDTSVEIDDDVEVEADDDEDEFIDESDDEDELDELDSLDADESDEDDEDDDSDGEDDESDEDEGRQQQIALIEGRVRPEIYEALIGAQPGETRTVTITYGDDEEDEELRGTSETYTLRVKNVQERLLPDWDELPTLAEFEGDLEGLRANARQRLERAAEDKARRELIDAFITHLTEQNAVDLPEAMIRERAQELFHQQVSEFQRYGITEEQFLSMTGKSHDEAVEQFMEQAEPDVRRSVIVREIIRREGLTISDEDLAAEQERFLEDFEPERRDEVQKLLSQPNMRQMIASAALDRQLRDRLVAIATGAVVAQAREEGSMTKGNEINHTEPTQPRVLDDVSTGGVTENSVFDDPGPDPTSESGTSSVEQATAGDYGQQNTDSDANRDDA